MATDQQQQPHPPHEDAPPPFDEIVIATTGSALEFARAALYQTIEYYSTHGTDGQRAFIADLGRGWVDKLIDTMQATAAAVLAVTSLADQSEPPSFATRAQVGPLDGTPPPGGGTGGGTRTHD